MLRADAGALLVLMHTRGTPRTMRAEAIARFGCDPILLPSQDILLSNIAPQGDVPIVLARRIDALGGHREEPDYPYGHPDAR